MKQRPDPSTKPYFKCLDCTFFRNDCGGIPTRDMTLQEWCEYMRDVKDAKRLKPYEIARVADTSDSTVERVLAINWDKDLLRDTARRIEIAVLGHAGRHLCARDYDDRATMEQIESLKSEVEYWRKENDRKAKVIDKLLDA